MRRAGVQGVCGRAFIERQLYADYLKSAEPSWKTEPHGQLEFLTVELNIGAKSFVPASHTLAIDQRSAKVVYSPPQELF